MGLLNYWIADMMQDADEKERQKQQEKKSIEQAQGRAALASSQLGDSGWQQWNPDGSLGAPSGYPASLGPVPTVNDWRYSPEASAKAVQDIREFKAAPDIASQRRSMLDLDKVAANESERRLLKQDYNGPIPFETMWSQRRSGITPEVVNSQTAATARQPFVSVTAADEAQANAIAAENLVRQRQMEQKLDMPTQIANAAFANSQNAEGIDKLGVVTSGAALERPDLIRSRVQSGLQHDIAANTYGGRVPEPAPGMTWVIDQGSGEMSMIPIPGYDQGLGSMTGSMPGLDSIGASDFPRKGNQRFTAGGIIGSPSLKNVLGSPQAAAVVPQAGAARTAIVNPEQQMLTADIVKAKLQEALGTKHPDTAANIRNTYETAVRRGLADEIGLPSQQIGSSVFNRNPITVLQEAIARPDGTNILQQIESMTPEQKNKIYRRALTEIGIR